jgi:CRP-like cAMP-binding protein
LTQTLSADRDQACTPGADHTFPDAGIGSVVVLGPGGQRVEAGLFGREGMSGLPVVLADELSPHEVVVQLAGHGHRIEAEALRAAMRAEPSLRDLLLRYVLATLGQSAITTFASTRLSLEARLARWLLMCHDRVDGDDLPLTHGFLSVMLGVRRAGVTVAVHVLEGRGLIRATRGRIQITERRGLEAAAGGIYGLAEAEYARIMGPRTGGATRADGEVAQAPRAPLRPLEHATTPHRPARASPGQIGPDQLP